MIDNSFYQGQQGECFKQLEKYFQEIKHEFDSRPNKVFLDPEDFSDSVRGLPDDFDDKSGDYVNGEWKALGIQSGDHEGQSFNDYPMLYSILRKFPYKTNVAIMTVGPNTKIGNHTDNEGGWRYQICLDDGGGTDSGMYVMDLKTKKQCAESNRPKTKIRDYRAQKFYWWKVFSDVRSWNVTCRTNEFKN